MNIEIVAIETSGLDRTTDQILELAIARIDLSGSYFWHSPVAAPDLQLSPEIIEFHTKTGLIKDLLECRVTPQVALAQLKPCNLRLLWAGYFAKNFLPGIGCVDASGVLALAKLKDAGFAQDAAPNRALQKVQLLHRAVMNLL
jgi:hypothetical protein